MAKKSRIQRRKRRTMKKQQNRETIGSEIQQQLLSKCNYKLGGLIAQYAIGYNRIRAWLQRVDCGTLSIRVRAGECMQWLSQAVLRDKEYLYKVAERDIAELIVATARKIGRDIAKEVGDAIIGSRPMIFVPSNFIDEVNRQYPIHTSAESHPLVFSKTYDTLKPFLGHYIQELYHCPNTHYQPTFWHARLYNRVNFE